MGLVIEAPRCPPWTSPPSGSVCNQSRPRWRSGPPPGPFRAAPGGVASSWRPGWSDRTCALPRLAAALEAGWRGSSGLGVRFARIGILSTVAAEHLPLANRIPRRRERARNAPPSNPTSQPPPDLRDPRLQPPLHEERRRDGRGRRHRLAGPSGGGLRPGDDRAARAILPSALPQFQWVYPCGSSGRTMLRAPMP